MENFFPHFCRSSFVLPSYEVPKLHEKIAFISFENHYSIRNAYCEIMGLHHIHHLSINIADPEDKLAVISYNPHIAYNLCHDSSYLYNGTMSPTYYRNSDIYVWDRCYDKRFKNLLKNNVERKNGFKKGIVITRRIENFVLIYSFATRSNGEDFYLDVFHNRKVFYEMGDHCYSLIRVIYEQYSPKYDPPKINETFLVHKNASQGNPKNKLTNKVVLKIIKNNTNED
ncbi:MAG: hypothetical protein A3F41_06780 [Coxiella sp. RIFCSPHIGHO2_12_FULL_44_14]|nr:MAG: hypothetical protein A3F41_06780 [Coxiella sp. RIFCSPHIGHO2_12_FULL_44_14]